MSARILTISSGSTVFLGRSSFSSSSDACDLLREEPLRDDPIHEDLLFDDPRREDIDLEDPCLELVLLDNLGSPSSASEKSGLVEVRDEVRDSGCLLATDVPDPALLTTPPPLQNE